MCARLKNLLMSIVLGVTSACVTAPATADPVIQYGRYAIQFDGDHPTEQGQIARLGWKFDTGVAVYGWAGEEDQQLRLRGQGIGKNDMTAFGGGLAYQIRDDFQLFLEYGVTQNEATPDGPSTNEMIKNALWTDHAYEGRYRPGARQWQGFPDSHTWKYEDIYGSSMTTEYEYELDDGDLWRIGLQWEVVKHVTISAAYRISTAKEIYSMWDVSPGIIPERHDYSGGPDCGCWWKNGEQVDFNGWEAGISINW